MSSNPTATVRIALVDEQPASQSQLRNILARPNHFTLTFEGEPGSSLFNTLRASTPEVLVMNGDIKAQKVFATLDGLAKHFPDLRVIVVTAVRKAGFVGRLVNLGACGIVLRDFEASTLVDAIERVAQNGVFFGKQVCKVISHLPSPSELTPDELGLTEREQEVLALICREKTSKEIGKELFLSHRTVDSHRRSLQKKTGSRNLVGLVMYAVRHGIV